MKRKTLVCGMLILFATGSLFTGEEPLRMAVSPFDDAATGAGSEISAALEEVLAKNPAFSVRKTGAVRSYLVLMEKVQCGLENPKALKRAAADLQVEYLVVGSASRIGENIEVDARAVDVNTWRVVCARGARTAGAASAASEIGGTFSELTRKGLVKREKSGGENPSLGIQDIREHYGNPPGTSYGGIFLEMLASGLGNRSLVNVIESRFTRHLAEEKVLEMAGVIENSDADDRFRIEGVRYRVTGDIRVFPDMICVNYVLHETENGRLVFMGIAEMTKPGALRPVAAHIAKVIEDVLNNRIGTLKIATVPTGADITLDDAPAGNTSRGPVVTNIEKGKHAVTARFPGYREYRGAIEIEARRVMDVTLRLERVNERLLREAMSLESRGLFAEAVVKYDEFVMETGNMPESNSALYRKGHVLLLKMNDYGKALEAFNALLDRYPDAVTRAEGYYGKALTYRAMGNEAMAKATAKFLTEVYPDSSSAAAAREIAEGSIKRR